MNQEEKSQRERYLYCGLLLSISIALILSLLLGAFAPEIASGILREPETATLLRLMCLAFVPASIHACLNGYFYGRNKTMQPSICQVLEQIVRVGGTYVIYLVLKEQSRPLTAVHAVWGFVISEAMGALISLTLFLFLKKKPILDGSSYIKSNTPHKLNSPNTKSPLPLYLLLQMAIPLTLNHLLLSLIGNLENLLIPGQLMAYGLSREEALSHFGVLSGMAMSVIFAPMAIIGSLAVVLLPRIAKAQGEGDILKVRELIKSALCCGIALGSLCTFLLLFTSDWVGSALFGNSLAGFYIQLLSILCPFLYTGILLNSILNGLGHASLSLGCNLLGCVLRLVGILVFVPRYGMYAYLVALILSSIVTVSVQLLLISKKKT